MRKKKPRVAVAMSGGVDSSVAAALLVEAGYEVIGLVMRLHDGASPVVAAAGEAAARLGIPLHVADFRRSFERAVVDAFCREYAAGRTPNPCVLCNLEMKFGLLRRKARSLGARFFATGHYARTWRDSDGRAHLKKAADRDKDQSYFLYMLGQKELDGTLFPLGAISKAKVRKKARLLGLPQPVRQESQEICFIPGGDYARFLKPRIPAAFKPGMVIDQSGNRLGRHRGIARYTVGQRKGLGISAARPLYVLSLDAVRNAVVVGRSEELTARSLVARDVRWVSDQPPGPRFGCRARIRYRHAEAPAVVAASGPAAWTVEFREPQRAIAPGQSVVFYRGLEVLGGGIIDQVCG